MEYQKMLLGEKPYFVSCVHSSYPMHCHNEIELLYCVHGCIKATVESTEYTLPEGSILLVSSLAMHQLTIDDDSFGLVLEFGSNFLGSQFNEFTTQKFSKCLITPDEQCEYRNRLEKPLRRIYKELSHPKKRHTLGNTGISARNLCNGCTLRSHAAPKCPKIEKSGQIP